MKFDYQILVKKKSRKTDNKNGLCLNAVVKTNFHLLPGITILGGGYISPN